jgi:hypothetical protein
VLLSILLQTSEPSASTDTLAGLAGFETATLRLADIFGQLETHSRTCNVYALCTIVVIIIIIVTSDIIGIISLDTANSVEVHHVTVFV